MRFHPHVDGAANELAGPHQRSVPGLRMHLDANRSALKGRRQGTKRAGDGTLQRGLAVARALPRRFVLRVQRARDAAEIGKFNAGVVAAGKSADFVVLDANPLEKIGNSRRINEVYLRGQKVDRAGLRAKWLAQRNQTNKSSLK